MTRKDYELIAKAFKLIITNTEEEFREEIVGARRVANVLSSYLQEENPRFNRMRFLKACAID